jgi:hypothetical protein
VVTFDLPKGGSNTAAYTRIRKDFARIDLNKFIHSKRLKGPRDLPHNTYVAHFSGDVSVDSSAKLGSFVRAEAKRIIKAHHPSGRLFVVVGKQWAWGTSNF